MKDLIIIGLVLLVIVLCIQLFRVYLVTKKIKDKFAGLERQSSKIVDELEKLDKNINKRLER